MNHAEKTRSEHMHDIVQGILVAVIVSILVNMPQWYHLRTTDEFQRPDVMIESSDETFYLTRVREAYDGHLSLGHPYMYERRDQRYPLGNLTEDILGTVMRVFDLRIKTLWIFADAFFPFLLALLLWFGTRRIIHDTRWRILLIGVIFLTGSMVWWKRPISPQATTVLPLIWFWLFLSPDREKLPFVIARGALVGLMTISYPFHWTYCFVAEWILTFPVLYPLSVRDRTIRVLAILAPFILCALPWITLTFDMIGNSDYSATLARLGFIDRHLPADIPFQILLFVALFMVCFVGISKEHRRNAIPFLVLLFAGFAVLNQMLITGKEGEFSSHYRQILIFPFWTSVIWALYMQFKKYKWLNLIIRRTLFLTILGFAIHAQITAWHTFGEAIPDPLEREQMIRYTDALNALPGEHVIATEDAIGRALTIYTSHYPFHVFETHMYLASDQEVVDRAIVQRALVPDYEIPQRAVAGAGFLNEQLYARILCKLRFALLTVDACNKTTDDFLPPSWFAFKNAPTPSQDEILAALRDAHVSYVFLKEIPRWMRPYGTIVQTIDGYDLFLFE